MRYIAYLEKYDAPTIQHIDTPPIPLEIVGGKFRKDGSVVIHTLSTSGDDEIIIIPTDGKWMFQSLEEAMNARSLEIDSNINPYEMVRSVREKRVVDQSISALWLLGLDPEPDITTNGQGLRISLVREFLKKGIPEFAEETGLTVDQLKMIESESVLAPYGYIDTIEKVYPNIRAVWIKNGCGTMTKKSK